VTKPFYLLVMCYSPIATTNQVLLRGRIATDDATSTQSSGI